MNDRERVLNTLIGLATTGAAIVGILSFIGAFFPLLGGDFVGAGLFLVASGLSFGLLSVAVLGR
jgi:hypothetical protein